MIETLSQLNELVNRGESLVGRDLGELCNPYDLYSPGIITLKRKKIEKKLFKYVFLAGIITIIFF